MRGLRCLVVGYRPRVGGFRRLTRQGRDARQHFAVCGYAASQFHDRLVSAHGDKFAAIARELVRGRLRACTQLDQTIGDRLDLGFQLVESLLRCVLSSLGVVYAARGVGARVPPAPQALVRVFVFTDPTLAALRRGSRYGLLRCRPWPACLFRRVR